MSDDLERHFHEPGLPDVLKPGMSGTACCNIRTALSSLGCRREWTKSDIYDEELQSVVLQFQTDNRKSWQPTRKAKTTASSLP